MSYGFNIKATRNIRNREFDLEIRLALIQGYGGWIQQHVDSGWDAYLFTFTFNQLAKSSDGIVQQMHRCVSRWYGRLLTRTVKDSRSPRWTPYLPKGIFVPDLPVFKRSKQQIQDVVLNDGLHMHGLVAANRWCRIKITLDDHFKENLDQYLIPGIRHIDVQRVTHKLLYTTDYGMKGLKRPAISPDHVLILPRSLRELPNRNRLPPPRDPIKDIQAAFNVSEEVARDMASRLLDQNQCQAT